MGLLDFISSVVRLNDGSYLSIQTDKPSYTAGELVTGRVRAHIFSPQPCTSIVIKVSGREYAQWDEERSETVWEGEGEQRKSRVIYHHTPHAAKQEIFTDLLIVSTIPHTLPPGVFDYPFSYPLRADLPGCVKVRMLSVSRQH